jgi:hypothetical protein
MTKMTWPLAAALALALSGLAFAADQIGYANSNADPNTTSVSPQNPLPVGVTINAGASFTTPSGTTAYAVGDLIANSGGAGSVVPLSFPVCRNAAGTGMVRRARIKTPDTGFAGATVRLHLYKNAPTVANGDNGVFSSTEAEWLENIDVTLDQVFSDPLEKGVGVPAHGVEVNFDCATGTQVISGLVEARGAITPQGAKTMSVVLETLAN